MSKEESYSPIAFLGLVADYKRKLKDGRQYDKYFPASQGTYDIVTNNGNVHRTVQEMDKYCRETLADTAKIAPILKGKTLVETLKNVFQFWYDHCQYKLDKDGVEEIRRPRRAWHDGQILSRNPKTEAQAGIDCDCFSLSVGSTLMNLGINFKFRITKYNAGWQHVYVVVPLPTDSKRYYVIDCVLNKFNEEKTYTDKFDHTMNSPKTFLGGIPLARLGAVADTSEYVAQDKINLLAGGHFVDSDDAIGSFGIVEGNSPLLKQIYDHIVATRDIMRKDPASMEIAGGAEEYIKMLDYAISKWNTPERDAALDLLEKKEQEQNAIIDKHGAVSGTDGGQEEEFGFTAEDDEAVDGLSGLGKFSLKAAGSSFFSNVKKGVQAVVKVNKAIVQKVAKGVKDAGASIVATTKKVAAVIKKFIVMANPLTLIARAGILLAMKVNLFHWAQRAYPGYFTQAEALKMGITPAAYELSKKAKAALEATFTKYGGKTSKLETYIKTGLARKKFSTSGLGFVVPAVIISSAPAIITMAAKVASAGVTEESYAAANKQGATASQAKARAVHGLGCLGDDDVVPDATNTNEPDPVVPPVTEADANNPKGGAFKKVVDMIKSWFGKKQNQTPEAGTGDDIAKKEAADAANPGDAGTAVEDQAKAAGKAAYDSVIASGGTVTDALAAQKKAYADAGGGNVGGVGIIIKAMDFIKANPIPVAIGGLVAAAAITLVVSEKARAMVGFGKKPKAALSGPGKTKTKVFKSGHEVKHPKKILPRGSKIKKVTLK